MAPDELKGPQRPNRGVTQKLKGGVLVGKAIMAALIAATMDSGNYTILEIADGGWSVMGVVDVSAGWSPELAQRLQGVSRRIETEKPDLVVLAPPPWVAKPTDDAGLWERRRAQLPLWRWVAEVWNLQAKGRRLVALVQPAYSQALHLSFLQERLEVVRVPLSLCAFMPKEARMDAQGGSGGEQGRFGSSIARKGLVSMWTRGHLLELGAMAGKGRRRVEGNGRTGYVTDC